MRRSRPQQSTYFVGRGDPGAAQLYTVTPGGVERLHSARRFGGSTIDWRTTITAAVELSFTLLTCVAERRPSPELTGHFAAQVVARLPDAGFVLDADEVRDWIGRASEPRDWSPCPAPRRRSWADRLRLLTGRIKP